MENTIIEMLKYRANKLKNGACSVCLHFSDGNSCETFANVFQEKDKYKIYINTKKCNKLIKSIFEETDIRDKLDGKDALILFDGEKEFELEWIVQ